MLTGDDKRGWQFLYLREMKRQTPPIPVIVYGLGRSTAKRRLSAGLGRHCAGDSVF
jgi:hypothetical protein